MALRIKGHHINIKITHLYHPTSKQKLIDPQAIADAFNHYYNTLYNLKDASTITQPSIEEIDSFLQEINLPKVCQNNSQY